MTVISWIILGLLAGAIAKFLLPGRDPGGLIGTTLIGIAGAFLGGWISARWMDHLQDGGVDPVRRHVGDVEGLDVLAHGAQRGPGRGEVGALFGEGVVVAGRGQGGASG